MGTDDYSNWLKIREKYKRELMLRGLRIIHRRMKRWECTQD